MQRVYLDLNVIAKIKQRDVDPYKIILDIINDNDRFIFPYSPAHLKDLSKGYSAKTKTLVESDLGFIHQISGDHCLYLNIKTKEVISTIIDPRNYFDQIIKNDTDVFDFDEMFNEDDEISSNPWKSYLETLKTIPSGIDLDKFKNEAAKYKDLMICFPNLFYDNSMYGLFKDISKLISSPKEFGGIYKSLRNKAIEELKINTDPTQWGSAFEYLDKLVKSSSINKSIFDLIDQFVKGGNKEILPSRFDYFTHYYLALDTLGYHRDDQFPNLILDAGHAFYAAYCDYFITEDRNTFEKAKAVYDHFKISTKVCKAKEFLNQVFSFSGLYSGTNESILDQIKKIYQTSLIVLNTIDDDFTPSSVYKIESPLIDYFNRMQINRYSNKTTLCLYKKKDTYSDFMFWKEIETIVNKVVGEFGIDDQLRDNFILDTEKDEIDNDKWTGRKWIRNDFIVQLFYNEDIPGMFLKITIFNWGLS